MKVDDASDNNNPSVTYWHPSASLQNRSATPASADQLAACSCQRPVQDVNIVLTNAIFHKPITGYSSDQTTDYQ